MELFKKEAELIIVDHDDEKTGLSRTTDLCIAAHQDDIEIMNFNAISECYGIRDRWFTGVVVTDGAGSPRDGIYESYTDEDMKKVRKTEQRNAAYLGGYAAQFLLSYSSGEVKDKENQQVIDELAQIIINTNPDTIYTHNLADKHDTHVAVALRTIAGIRSLPKDKRPKKLYSMEVWRSLDWLNDEDKTVFDTSAHPGLSAALLGVFDSQVAGGKRYDLAAQGRRVANATFFTAYGVDESASSSYSVDLTPLIEDDSINPKEYILGFIDRFKNDVNNKIEKLGD